MNALPTALLTETFSYLDLQDLAKCSRTHARWQQLAKNQKAWVDVLQTPYEIGQFIISQVSDLDDTSPGKPWGCVSNEFAEGPNPYFDQMRRGLILEVECSVPKRIYTRYGQVRLLGTTGGNFKAIFKLVESALKLQYIEQGIYRAKYAIKSWKGQTLPEPIQADREYFIPYETAQAAFAKFQKHEPLLSADPTESPANKKRKLATPQGKQYVHTNNS